MRIMQLRDESAEAGQAHAGHAGDDEGDGGERDDLVEIHRAESGEIAGVGAGVDHAADDGEQKAGEDAVGEHLQDGAARARSGSGSSGRAG